MLDGSLAVATALVVPREEPVRLDIARLDTEHGLEVLGGCVGLALPG